MGRTPSSSIGDIGVRPIFNQKSDELKAVGLGNCVREGCTAKSILRIDILSRVIEVSIGSFLERGEEEFLKKLLRLKLTYRAILQQFNQC